MYVMNDSVRKGRNYTVAVIVIFIGFNLIDLVTSILYVQNVGYGRAASNIISLIISLIIVIYLSKGANWARILIGALLILSSLTYVGRIIEAAAYSAPIDWFIILIAVAFIINIAAGFAVLKSQYIKSFMEFKRGKLEI